MSLQLRVILLVAVAASVLVPHPARACGGLFCSAGSPAPVDQSAEQVLFEIGADDSVTVTVQVRYSGDSADFSWIVPVPGTPTTVDVASPALFRLLDPATRPLILPPPTTCPNPFPTGNGFVEGDDGVFVTELSDVGPYDDIVVVEGADPELVIDWLNDHQYLVTAAMEPAIRQYSLEGYKFLALRMQPGVDTSTIQPLRFHCPAPNPTVPLRLTALAAEPEMSVVVTVVGPGRVEPANWGEVEIDVDDVYFDTVRSNYFPLVSLKVDEAGGDALVVERAGPSEPIAAAVDVQYRTLVNNGSATEDDRAALDDLRAMFSRAPYLTRFYTRVSPDEMVDDPIFVPSTRGDVSGTLDLTDRETIDVCPPPPITPCAFTYCGLEGLCGETSQGALAGCRCPASTRARTVSAPLGVGRRQVACMAESSNVLDDDVNVPACSGVTCGGHGTCTAINGAPTCACDDGFFAVADPFEAGSVACRKPERTWTPQVIVQPVPADVGATPRRSSFFGCGADASGRAASAALLLLAVVLHRRRPR